MTELDKTLELDEDHLFWVSYAAVQLSRFPSISFEISFKLHYQPCRHVFINTFGTALDMECSHVSYMPISGVEFASVMSENSTVKPRRNNYALHQAAGWESGTGGKLSGVILTLALKVGCRQPMRGSMSMVWS